MQTTEEQKTQQKEPVVGSRYEANTIQQVVGSPWSTGLFDCHENQTNGNFIELVYLSVSTFVKNCKQKT